MLLNNKVRTLLENFLVKKTLSIKEIENILHLKQRSCYLYIEQINDFLQANNFLKIVRDSDFNYQFVQEVNPVLELLNNSDFIYYSNDERKNIILFKLIIFKTVQIKELLNIFNISLSLLRKDIVELSESHKDIFEINLSNKQVTLSYENKLLLRSQLCKTIYFENNYINNFLDTIPSNFFELLLNLLEENCRLTISQFFKSLLINFLKSIYLENYLTPPIF